MDFRDAGDHVRRAATQRFHILHKLVLVLSGEFGERNSSFSRSFKSLKNRLHVPLDDLVIDIRNVHHKLHIVVKVIAENTHDNVLTQIGSTLQKNDFSLPSVAHVSDIIHSRTTTVPQYFTRNHRDEGNLFLTPFILIHLCAGQAIRHHDGGAIQLLSLLILDDFRLNPVRQHCLLCLHFSASIREKYRILFQASER